MTDQQVYISDKNVDMSLRDSWDDYSGGKANVKIETDVVNPKRHIGLLSAVTFGAGCMIGSGIFVSPKGALHNAGSIGKCVSCFC